jgi:hypothetical protein
MKKNKIVFVSVFCLLLIVCGVYFSYSYLFKASRDIGSEKPTFSMSAMKLLDSYNADPKKADSLYLNKTIEISGLVTSVNDSVVIVRNSVFCLFGDKISKGLMKNVVTVKGKCIGYDELFQEVKLDQCIIIK